MVSTFGIHLMSLVFAALSLAALASFTSAQRYSSRSAS